MPVTGNFGNLVPGGPSTGFAFFDYPAEVVAGNIGIMNARADEMLALAEATIAALGNVDLPTDSPQPSKFTIPNINMPSAVAPKAPVEGKDLFGVVPDFSDPGYVDVGAANGVDGSLLLKPDKFTPTIGNPDIPEAPGPVDISGEPDMPDVTDPTIPDAPTWTAPDVPQLVPITLPVFVGVTAPTINDVEPTFTGSEPHGIIYTEPTFSDSLSDATKALILHWYQGGTGLPAAIQQALFDAARSREEQTALAAEQDAMDTWAARNFSMPPGMLVEAVTIAQERSRFAANELERQILIKSQEWEIENLRHAMTQGVEYLEKVLVNLFEKMAQRTFEAARAQSEIEVKIYDVAVALYNAQQSARRVGADIYRAKWDGEIAKVTAFKTQIDGEVAKGQLNEQLVRIYLGEWEGVKNIIEAYNGELRGAQTIAEIARMHIDRYGIGVTAYAKKIDVRKIPFETWVERVRGEGFKASMYAAQAQGYAETVKAQENEANVKIQYIQLKIASSRASVETYVAKLQATRDFLHAQLDAINARATTFQADTGRYRAEIEGENMQLSKDLQVSEMRLQNDIAYYGTQLREFDAVLNRQIERGKIIVEALKSAGQISSSLAAGAMSAIHVQANIAGTGGVQDNNYFSRSKSQQGTAQYNWSGLVPPLEPPPDIP